MLICAMVRIHTVMGMQAARLLTCYYQPVIVSNVGAMGELVSSDNVGLVVRPGDADSLAEAIISVLGSAEKFKCRYVPELQSKYDWKHIAELTTRSYKAAIGGRYPG